MAAKTLAQQLDAVQTAIAAVEAGAQSYTDEAGANITYPGLDILYQREERLLKLITAASPMEQRVAEF